MEESLKRRLRRYAAKYETEDFFRNDPSFFMRSLRGPASGEANRETTAFVASCLAFGQISQFMPKIGRLDDLAGGDMYGWIRTGAFRETIVPDGRCFYRFVSNSHLHSFLSAYGAILRDHGTLGAYVESRGDGTGLGAVKAICAAFAGSGSGYLVPIDAKSACKRICLFLRWMVRGGSPVDIGCWARFIDRRTLVMPLDTHVVQEARSLGMLPENAGATIATALKLTALMAEAFPDDPLKGDFALYGHNLELSSGREPRSRPA